MKKLIFPILLALLFTACKPDNPCEGEKVTLRDLSGLDGCTWVFENEAGDRLEPQNLDDHISNPVDGNKYFVTYSYYPGGGICMVGPIIVIDCISER